MLPSAPRSTLFPYTTLFRSVADEAGAHVVGHRPAHHRPGADVYDRRQVQPALSGADVGDVAAPQGVELDGPRSEEHTSELQSHHDLVCRLLLKKQNKQVEQL